MMALPSSTHAIRICVWAMLDDEFRVGGHLCLTRHGGKRSQEEPQPHTKHCSELQSPLVLAAVQSTKQYIPKNHSIYVVMMELLENYQEPSRIIIGTISRFLAGS